jgi:hypothetical protein
VNTHGRMISQRNTDLIMFWIVMPPKTKFLRIQSIWYNQQLMDILFVYLHKGKLAQGEHSLPMIQIEIH